MPEPDSTPTLDELLVHAGWLRGLATHLVADGASAEDLVQDTWITALERPRRSGVPVGPWLAKVLRNRAKDLGRSGARRQHREQVAARSEALPSTAELSARAEASRDLVTHVLELPEAQRQVLMLRHYEGLETARIAELLGVTEGAVRSRLSRGHALLRERLDQSRGGDRAAWLAALAPLSVPSAAPAAAPVAAGFLGGLLVSTKTQLALGVALLSSAGLAALLFTWPEAPMAPADGMPGSVGDALADVGGGASSRDAMPAEPIPGAAGPRRTPVRVQWH